MVIGAKERGVGYQILDDVLIVELAQGVAGPLAGKLLSNWGAQVIKVEPPEGDLSRRMGPFPSDVPDLDASGWFLYLNTAKKGVTLDVSTSTGQALVKRLLVDADVLIEDLSAEAQEAFGLGYETLAELNPRLVVSSITPFGKHGPYAGYKATDMVLQAMGGYMSVNGDPEQPPLQIPLEHGLHMAGRQVALATLMALHHQRETGEGQHIDTSALECVFMEPSFMMLWYTYLGGIEGRGRGYGLRVVDGDLKECKDGWIALTADGGNPWSAFAPFFGVPELADEKFAARAGRREHRKALASLVEPALKKREKMELFDSAIKDRFVFGPVQTPEEVLRCPQLTARGFFEEVSHPKTGPMKYPGPGMTLLGHPPASGPAPCLGQHNAEVYCERLGYSREELTQLRNLGVL
jgi:crotonobetainyl-CoA:carnitine CoA-transferase CaiB-like acyl-CoA transferase